MNNKSKEASQLKILVAEPERDIRYIYKLYFESIGLHIIIVENGLQCMCQLIMNNYNKQKIDNFPSSKEYDIIIIDTHIQDSDALETAKEILCKLPEQRIILTTTLPIESIKLKSISIGIDAQDILQKQFELDELFSLIEKENRKLAKRSEKIVFPPILDKYKEPELIRLGYLTNANTVLH